MPGNARKCPIALCKIGVFCLNIAGIGHGFNSRLVGTKGAKAASMKTWGGMTVSAMFAVPHGRDARATFGISLFIRATQLWLFTLYCILPPCQALNRGKSKNDSAHRSGLFIRVNPCSRRVGIKFFFCATETLVVMTGEIGDF